MADAIDLKNHEPGATIAASELVSTDFLQLVRFGLRPANHKVVRDTITVIDGVLKVDTPNGPSWHRYNKDGYGERADGSAFLGVGIGRLWPLLTGERGHYALAAGEDVLPYLQTMNRMAGRGRLIPEQVWDTDPIPAKFLYPGQPTGSAMPLVWAHAEFVKLAASRRKGAVMDRLGVVARRYDRRPPAPPWAHWSRRARITHIRAGAGLRLLLDAPATVHWSADGWTTIEDTSTHPSDFALHLAEIPARRLKRGATLVFTLYDRDSSTWEGRDYTVTVSR